MADEPKEQRTVDEIEREIEETVRLDENWWGWLRSLDHRFDVLFLLRRFKAIYGALNEAAKVYADRENTPDHELQIDFILAERNELVEKLRLFLQLVNTSPAGEKD